jgi:hypothetical protein
VLTVDGSVFLGLSVLQMLCGHLWIVEFFCLKDSQRMDRVVQRPAFLLTVAVAREFLKASVDRIFSREYFFFNLYGVTFKDSFLVRVLPRGIR